jgi:predicted membrane protein
MEEECFGIPRGGSIVGIVIGLIIVLFGVSTILAHYYNIDLQVWPIIVIIFGILIVIGAYYGMRRRY